MRMEKVSHVGSVNNEANKWSLMDDWALAVMVGKLTYRQIAVRLGRTETSVQRRASHKRLSAHAERRKDREARQAHQERLLAESEESLSKYLPEGVDD